MTDENAPPEAPSAPRFPARLTDLLLILIVSLGGMRILSALVAGMLFTGAFTPGGGGTPPSSGSLLAFTVVMAVAETLALIASVYFFVVRKHGLSWADIGLRPVARLWYGRAAVFAVLLVPAVGLVNALIGKLTGGPFENPQIYAIAPGGFSWSGLLLMLAVVGVVAPFGEEIAFRGVLFPWLRDRYGVVVGALGSALFFSLMHGLPQLIPALFLVGAVLAMLYQRSGSLWPAVVTHGLFNSLMVLALYAALAADVPIP